MFRAGADTATIPHSSKPRTLAAIIFEISLIFEL